MTDKRIGTMNADGTVSYPEQNLAEGVYRAPALQLHSIGNNRFVVLDNVPEDFDVVAAAKELRAPVTPFVEAQAAKLADDSQSIVPPTVKPGSK